MSVNILELLKQHLSGDVVSNLASLIGESPKNTESAIQSALPSLLAGLVSKSSDSSALGTLFNLLTSGDHDGGLLSNLGALTRGGDETTKLIANGGSLLSSIFGDKAGGIIDLIANVSGIGNKSSSSLLGFLSPVVMGLIGKTLKTQNLGSIAGLTSLLKDQESFIKNLLPAGLGNLLPAGALGLAAGSGESAFDKAVNTLDADTNVNKPDIVDSLSGAFDKISDKVEDVAEDTLSAAKNAVEDIGETASKYGSQVVDEGREFAQSAADAFEEGGSKWLPWLLVLAALALLWGLIKSCSTTEPTDTTATKEPTEAPAVATPAPVVTPPPAAPAPAVTPPPAAPAVDSTVYEKGLSTGYMIKSAKDGLESKLVTFIESSDPISKDLWFTMDGIQFDTAKATIRKESQPQIDNIAEIMKAFPKVKIKIGGYTDNTGKAAGNLKLSKNRANAVKTALVKKGTAAARIEAEGYGSEHPVASNDTPEGRQQNRRIDVRVTEK